GTVLLKASWAVTVKLKAVPPVADAGADTAKWVAVPAVTLIEFDVPVIEDVTVSVAAMVCVPAVFSVAENVPTPLGRRGVGWGEGGGAVGAGRVLLKASGAVTEKLKAVPPVADAGADTAKWVAVPAVTLIEFDVPVIEDVTVSVAAMVCVPAVFSVAENVPTPLVKVAFAGNVAAPSLLVTGHARLSPVASLFDD